MDITPLVREGQQIIKSYAAGVFHISGVSYEGAVLVSPIETAPWLLGDDSSMCANRPFNDLSFENFQPLISCADDIDIVLLGAGERTGFFDPDLRKKLGEKGLSIDVMDTGAACRTYNVLMAEGRRVVAALLPI